MDKKIINFLNRILQATIADVGRTEQSDHDPETGQWAKKDEGAHAKGDFEPQYDNYLWEGVYNWDSFTTVNFNPGDNEKTEKEAEQRNKQLGDLLDNYGEAALAEEFYKAAISHNNSQISQMDGDLVDKGDRYNTLIWKSSELLFDTIGESRLANWFDGQDYHYKCSISKFVMFRPELRSAAMNLMYCFYNRYKEKQQYAEKGSLAENEYEDFQKWLVTPVDLYRGDKEHPERHPEVDEEHTIFSSYSFDKKIAQRFANGIKGGYVSHIKVKPIDTLGSMCDHMGELEVWVPFYATKDEVRE